MKSLLLASAIVLALASCAHKETPKQVTPPPARAALTVHAGAVPLMDETPYTSAIGNNDSNAAFYGREDAFADAYHGMLQNLSGFLKKNNFKWGGEINYFNHVYFNANGTIDYYFYNFRGNIPAEKERQFDTLIKEFVKTYKLPMTAKTKFVQCSGVVMSDI